MSENDTLNSIKKLSIFVIFKIMIPLFFFCLCAISLIFLQIYVSDYCFYPELCSCDNIFVYVYTALNELLHTQAVMIFMLYYGSAFVTNDFNKKTIIKFIYFICHFLILLIYLLINYDKRHSPIFEFINSTCGLLLFVGNFFFLIIFGILYRLFSKKFLKRFLASSVLQLYLYFHRFYFKNYATFYVLQLLEDHYDKSFSLSLFKIFLMIYYIIYEYLSKQFLLSFFKEIISEKTLSYNIIIFAMKFVSIDVLSIKALNILSSPLSDFVSWISFISYIYSIFSVYSRTNLIKCLFQRFMYKIFKIMKIKEKTTEVQRFENLRSGCIFESNLIVFLRIISYKSLHYFMIFTKQSNLYEDCSLQEKNSNFMVYDGNTILLMLTHTFILVFMGVVIFGFKKNNILFNYHIEEVNFVSRLVLFLICFSYADYTLQMYKAFSDMN